MATNVVTLKGRRAKSLVERMQEHDRLYHEAFARQMEAGKEAKKHANALASLAAEWRRINGIVV